MVTQINPAGLPLANAAQMSTGPASAVIVAQSAGEAKALRPVQGQPDPEVALAQVNEHLGTTRTNLKLQVDLASNRGYFQVVQERTGMVLLQVPSDEVLAMSHRIQESTNLKETPGALVDKQG